MTPDWIFLPGGRFWMGGGPRDNENPRHEVRVSPFQLARTQVTREEYQAFLDATVRPAPPFWGEPAFSHPRMPAVGPSWEDAMAFCAWAGAHSGVAVRLPTEAEWEHAARAGRDVLYPWGDEPPESLPDYERVRADGALFLIRPGHETVDVEDVVEETPAFHVVRKKDGGPAELAREHDPRSD